MFTMLMFITPNLIQNELSVMSNLTPELTFRLFNISKMTPNLWHTLSTFSTGIEIITKSDGSVAIWSKNIPPAVVISTTL